ncbi:helicase-exonuclease AddAB subunit AddB [Brassicibacter mesophilus]|uniref:helicase-exonuclease AddAB subunit AddB n=1 Tax=Brassicibacter mesophilus TaxID=745119 RepID=UPI003D22B2AB
MKLRYILGRAGVGKTSLVLHEIDYRLKENSEHRLVLLVPEQFTLQAEADLINKKGLDGIMRVEVLSFERLAYKVLSEVGGIKKATINELGKIMVLRKLFDENSQDLSVFKKGSKQEGFLSNFCSLVSEFKRNDISYELLESKINSIEDDNMLKRKLQDISLIYKNFNDYLDGKYTDEEDKMNLLIQKIEDSDYFYDCEIWIDGFNSFSSQEYKILEKLALKSRKLSISLTLDETRNRDYDMFKPVLDTYQRLRKIAEANGVKESRTVVENEVLHRHEQLKYLEKELYSYPYNKYKEQVDRVQVFSGMNQYTEIENIACQIISLVRDKDYRWRDIAVVCNHMDIYAPTIKKVFSEYGVPYFIDEKRSIMNNPIIKFILSGLEIISRGFKYEDVFRLIKTGFSELNKTEYEKLENYVLKYGIAGDKWLSDFVFEDDDLEEINLIRNRFIASIVNLKNKIRNKNLVSDLTKYLFDFLNEMNIEEKLNYLIDTQKNKGNLEYVNENTQIWNIVMEVFDQLVEILGDTRVNLKEYIKILESGLSEYEVGIIPPTMDQVLIGNLDRSKSHNIKALFVVGVNDGILPSSFEDGGLLLDEEKVAMKEIGMEIYSDNETRVSEEKFAIYTSFAKPSEYLFISYALSDNEGKALRPSILIDRLKKLYTNIVPQSDISKNREKELKLIATPISTFKYLTENLRSYVDGNNIDEIWWDVYNWYYSNEVWKKRINLVIDGLFHTNQQEYIDEGYSRALYDMPFKSSISRLENFVNCPFSHFINYGLKPKERKIHVLKSPDVGLLFHNSIEEFSKELSIENLNWKDIQRDKSDEIVDRVLDRMIEDFQHGVLLSTHRYKYLVNKLKRISKRALWTLTEHVRHGDFVPFQYELSFGDGPEKKIPPIVIKLANGEEIKLEGRIDRVDILKDENGSYVKVIDYKSGNKSFSLSDAYYGLQIQLIVYLDAVVSNKDKLIKDELYPAGVFYFRIDDPMIKTDEDDIEIIEAEISKQLKMDGIILKDIKVIRAMDKSIEETGSSNIIPVSLKKDGDFTKSSSVFEKEDLEGLVKHVKNLIGEIAVEILKGKIRIEPCKLDDKVSCDYCQLASICQFDTSFDDNKYKALKKLKDDEVLRRVKGNIGGEE